MSIEFSLGDLIRGMIQEDYIPADREPNPDRYMSVLDLLKDHQTRLDEAQETMAASENGMLEPRVTFRDHSDMHLITTAFNEYMTKVTDEWYNATTAYGMGNNSETLETLTIRSREITNAAQLMHAMERLHVKWAKANAVQAQGVADEHTYEFPDSYEGDRERWGDSDEL